MADTADKPGYKTTEFWLAAIAEIVGLVLASGVVAAGGLAAKVVGAVVAILAGLGYTASRTITKNGL